MGVVHFTPLPNPHINPFSGDFMEQPARFLYRLNPMLYPMPRGYRALPLAGPTAVGMQLNFGDLGSPLGNHGLGSAIMAPASVMRRT